MTPTPLAFVDIETTSLARPFSPTPGEVWEVAVIVRSDGGRQERTERWLLPVTLKHADPVSLEISGFHRRHPLGVDWQTNDADLDAFVQPDQLEQWAKEFASITAGCHLVGNVVSFDEERLAALLMVHGVKPNWHYHLIDVESMTAGCLAGRARYRYGMAQCEDDIKVAEGLEAVATPRWDSEELSAALRVRVPEEDRHTALGDARWALAMYDAVMGTGIPAGTR